MASLTEPKIEKAKAMLQEAFDAAIDALFDGKQTEAATARAALEEIEKWFADTQARLSEMKKQCGG